MQEETEPNGAVDARFDSWLAQLEQALKVQALLSFDVKITQYFLLLVDWTRRYLDLEF